MYSLSSPQKLVDALRLCFPDSSRNTLLQWIAQGRICVDGTPIQKPHHLLSPGSQISLGKPTFLRTVSGLNILYQDRWMVAIDKPEGLLSFPAETPQIHAIDLLQAGLHSSIFPVHRLDQDTSGVILYARSETAEEKLKVLFQTHTISRSYCAIVAGHLPEESGTWHHKLKERADYSVHVSAEGKEAITHFEVLRRSRYFSYLHLRLETGRKHQIRVQCAYTGYPILGDRRYGSTADPVRRLCLHAYSLSFLHPFTGKRISLRAPLPSPFHTLGFPESAIQEAHVS